MHSQEQILQRVMLDLLVEPEAGSAFDEDPDRFGQDRGLVPFHGAALLRFKDRLQIYRDATRSGTQELLEHFFPLTQALLEQEGAWDGCVSDFIGSRSITTPFFRDIIPSFVQWLSGTAWGHDRWPSLLALAHFELLEFLVERWPDDSVMPELKTQASPVSRIVLDPGTRVVHYAHAVHRVTLAEPLPEASPVHLLVYRDRTGDHHVMEITDSTAALVLKGQEMPLKAAMSSLGISDLAGALSLLQDLFDREALWGFQAG